MLRWILTPSSVPTTAATFRARGTKDETQQLEVGEADRRLPTLSALWWVQSFGYLLWTHNLQWTVEKEHQGEGRYTSWRAIACPWVKKTHKAMGASSLLRSPRPTHIHHMVVQKMLVVCSPAQSSEQWPGMMWLHPLCYHQPQFCWTRNHSQALEGNSRGGIEKHLVPPPKRSGKMSLLITNRNVRKCKACSS